VAEAAQNTRTRRERDTVRPSVHYCGWTVPAVVVLTSIALLPP
jgi:hypothetical protein